MWWSVGQCLLVICSVWIMADLIIFGVLWHGARIRAMKDKCNRCKKKFELTADNTVAYLYSNRGCEDYSYYTAVCTKCETNNWTFCKDYLKELMEIIRTTGCKVLVEKYPSDEIMADWCKVYGVELLEERELTDIDECMIGFWQFLLSADDKWVWQEFDR